MEYGFLAYIENRKYARKSFQTCSILSSKNNMHYLQYYPVDIVNGEGTRCTLFVSGCEHACRGCYNQKSWPFSAGLEFDEAMEQQILKDLKDTRIKRQGLTLSGGDPMHPRNLETLLPFVQRIKAECPDKDIWVWTGYKIEELTGIQRQMLSYVDVIIDGKFEQSKADPALVWRGSSNQNVYRVHKENQRIDFVQIL
ncbi:ribonucleoside-triphosphate reductase class III activase subunit [Pasteurella langaaensis DSM 22999]|uniref:Anaerobic ribonucleoside-triphosphate reductase-activating protein n=2 Tax=Alitibacter langaaensis TaxID=756 RepID=A0A2U0SNX4_9PAST|nr:ribonucleoside-triphosphate reductase class III activase subunit [Pasteurella langaaensis DSM 22999]